MFSKAFQVAYLAFTLGVVAVGVEKRTVLDNVTLYAYGPGISGLPISVGSKGIAVISNSTDSDDVVAITWNIATDGTASWNASANSSSTAISPGSNFYIIPTTDAFSAAGFVDADDTPPSGAVTTGFALWGSDVMYISGEKYLSQFWAQPTTTDTYELVWNSSGDSHDGAVPVNLKPKAPRSADV